MIRLKLLYAITFSFSAGIRINMHIVWQQSYFQKKKRSCSLEIREDELEQSVKELREK